MGGSLCGGNVFNGTPNAAVSEWQLCSHPGDIEGEVHMLITGIDYTGDQTWAGQNPLDTRYGFDIMVDLAQKCNVATIKTLWNREVTKEGLTAAIEEVGALCGPEDYFIIYYTGHGDLLVDDDQDELSGKDSALCLLGPDGNVEPREEVWMRDDDFVDAIVDSVEPSVKVMVLADCCHSGTLLDLRTSEFPAREQTCISITGCEDSQTSAGTGKGGLFTRSMSRAVQGLQEDGEEDYMVSKLYNRTLEEYKAHKFPGHSQDITIHGCMLRPTELPWPLIPTEPYISPVNTSMKGKLLDT